MSEVSRALLLRLLLLLCAATFGDPLEADTNGASCGPMEIYDVALPSRVSAKEAAGATEIVVLRYIPGDTTVETEYRIVLLANTSGHIRAWRTEAAGPSIQSQMRQLLQKGQRPCLEIAEHINLRSVEFADQRVLKSILHNLYKLRPSLRLASEFYLDAPRYEIAMEAGMNTAAWQLSGPSDSPLIGWFKRTSAALRIDGSNSARR